ncbi:hypothetical protein Micbo1qcDRAFT_209421 [Microdochium bolleyi]|uniref:Uncharacterized protein n=1 Tax=Microdochium bolleyi TaxID=196109 RepID=A0A136IMB0_9PEZI|nr:hypothetical protein Micbo1qcDRAFT_209421 [Microdochium bolleyi]
MYFGQATALAAFALLDLVSGQQFILRYRFAGDDLPQVTSATRPTTGASSSSSSSSVPDSLSVPSSSASTTSAATNSISSELCSVIATVTSTVTDDTQTVTSTLMTTIRSTAPASMTTTITATEDQTSIVEESISSTTTTTVTVLTVFEALAGCAFPTLTAKKRDAPTPDALAGYADGPALSSVCDCLDLSGAPSTFTTTIATSFVTTVTELVTETLGADAPTETATETLTQSTVITSTMTSLAIETSTFAVETVTTFRIAFEGLPYNGNKFVMEGTQVALDNAGAAGDIFGIFEGRELRVQTGAGTFGPSARNALIPGAAGADVYFDTRNQPLVTCQVRRDGDGTCPLRCRAFGGDVNFRCGRYWMLGGLLDAAIAGCPPFFSWAIDP